jgi:WD40 repeat protein
MPWCNPCWLAVLLAVVVPVSTAFGQPRNDALGDPLPPGALARLGTLRLRHVGSHIDAAALTPDGKTIASVGWNGRCRLWDAITGKELCQFESHESASCLAFSPDGKVVAAGCSSVVTVAEVANGKTVCELEGHPREIVGVGFADAGKTIIAACHDGSIHWWDLAQRKKTHSWEPWVKDHLPTLTGGKLLTGFWKGTVAPDGLSLVVQTASVNLEQGHSSSSAEPTLVVFDLAGRKERWRATGRVYQPPFAFSSDSKRLAFSLDPHVAQVCEVVTGRQLGGAIRFPPGSSTRDWIMALAFAPDGHTLAMAGDDLEGVGLCHLDDTTSVRLWPVRAGDGEDRSIRNLVYSLDGNTLLVATRQSLQLYDLSSSKEKLAADGHRGPIGYLAFTSDGRHLLTGSSPAPLFPHEVLTLDTASWKETQRSILAGRFKNLVAASADHSAAIIRDDQGTMAVIDMASGQRLGQLAEDNRCRAIRTGSFARSGQFFVGRSDPDRGAVQLWVALPSGKLLFQTPASYSPDPCAFSADGRAVALFDPDGKLQILDPKTGRVRWLLGDSIPGWVAEHTRTTLAFSPDGQALGSWNSIHGDLRLWSMRTGRLLQQVPCSRTHDNVHPVCLAWSADGRMLAVAGDFGNAAPIQIWEVNTGKLRREWKSETDAVRVLAFSPDCRLLAAGNNDSTVLIWDVQGKDK